MPALPRAGVDTKALAHVVSALDNRGLRVDAWPTPDRLRRMLVASAVPVLDHERYQVGNGFVSWETTRKYLEGFSGTDFARLFCPGLDSGIDFTEELGGYRLTDRLAVPFLLEVWEKSIRRWAFDMDLYKPHVLEP